MSSLLDQIVARRRIRLEQAKSGLPGESLRKGLRPSQRSLVKALRDPHPAFILECKKASPSQGLIRPEYDPAAIAAAYDPWASAISVLTEPDSFQGSLEDLRTVRQTTRHPVLCKDFVVDPWQVWAARSFGADAILLILAILDDDLYRQLAGLAESLGLDVLTEVSNPEELSRAIQLAAPVVGINNRNLRDMSIDHNRTRELADRLPGDVIVISESGWFENGEIRQMSDVADGFLIGSSLMACPDPGLAARRVVLGNHKVCGLTRPQDARVADESGAVYGGVILAASSPRRVTPDQARQVFGQTRLNRVGVFQNQSPVEILEVVAHVGLDVIQLHGEETPGEVAELRQQLPDQVALWKALTVDRLADAAGEFRSAGAEKLLIDSRCDGQTGGTGQRFDWARLPACQRDQLILAGGLGVTNVQEALQLGCYGLDFNSTLETAAGVKSPERIRQLFQRIRHY